MSDWTPATLSNLAGSDFTFILDGTNEVVVAPFDTPFEAMQFIGNTGPKFEYSPSEAAVRVDGTVIPLPKRPHARRMCGPAECDMRISGHKDHYIPVLRALNQRDNWHPIELLSIEGAKVVFACGDEVRTVYHHDPALVMECDEYNPDWNVLRKRHPNHFTVALLSSKPIGPCTCA